MKTLTIFLLIIIILTVVVAVFIREVMVARPELCTACHFIEPYYRKWERSTHNRVPCLTCHEYGLLRTFSGQLRTMMGTYSPRPLTNVPDAKCLQPGCHEKRLIESKEIFTRWNIVFDHAPHFTELRRGISLHCRSCHSDIVQGEHMKVSVTVCFLCHLAGSDSAQGDDRCLACHRALKKTVRHRGSLLVHGAAGPGGRPCAACHLSVKTGDGSVPRERCYFCHVDRTEKYGDPDFVHQQHVTKRQIDCLFCHLIVEHGNVKMAKDPERLSRRRGD